MSDVALDKGGEPSAETAAPARTSILLQHVSQLMISVIVVLVGFGVYDVAVRQPRTPRLGVVDVGQLYGLAHDQAARVALKAVQSAASGPAAATQAGEAIGNLYRTPQDFGPAFSRVLEGLSADCRCTLVAMAAVFGAASTVPDYTAEAARRMGLEALDERRGTGGEQQ